MSLLEASPIIFLVTFAANGPGFQEMESCSLLVNLRKGMQSSSEQPLVGEKHCLTTLITAAKESNSWHASHDRNDLLRDVNLHNC